MAGGVLVVVVGKRRLGSASQPHCDNHLPHHLHGIQTEIFHLLLRKLAGSFPSLRCFLSKIDSCHDKNIVLYTSSWEPTRSVASTLCIHPRDIVSYNNRLCLFFSIFVLTKVCPIPCFLGVDGLRCFPLVYHLSISFPWNTDRILVFSSNRLASLLPSLLRIVTTKISPIHYFLRVNWLHSFLLLEIVVTETFPYIWFLGNQSAPFVPPPCAITRAFLLLWSTALFPRFCHNKNCPSMRFPTGGLVPALQAIEFPYIPEYTSRLAPLRPPWSGHERADMGTYSRTAIKVKASKKEVGMSFQRMLDIVGIYM